MRDIIRMSLISSSLSPIFLEDRAIRSQINVLISAPFGIGKTDLLTRIETAGLGLKVQTWTTAALFGSIRKNGGIVSAMTTLAAGKTVLIDEFQSIPFHLRQPLLTLTEEQTVARMLSFNVPIPINYSERFYSFTADKGYLKFKIRSSFIITTASLVFDEQTQMLCSRCVPFFLKFNFGDVGKAIADIDLTGIERLREELVEEKPRVTTDDENDLLVIVTEELKERDISANYVYRLKDEMLRLMNISMLLGNSKDDAFSYFGELLSGIQSQALSISEFDIVERVRRGDKVRSSECDRSLLSELVRKKLVEVNDENVHILSPK